MDHPAETTSVVEYSTTAAGLAALRHRLKDRAYDLRTTRGNEEARRDRHECVRLRTALESRRQEIKAPALERCRMIDAEAKRITAEIFALELPIDGQIKADEARREQDRQRKAEAERQRIAGIQQRLGEITAIAFASVGQPAAVIEARIVVLDVWAIGDEFGEFKSDAEKAKADTLAKLREMHAIQVEFDREREQAAALEAERRQRIADEKAERDRIEQEQSAERARMAAERAELARQAEAQKAEMDRLEAAARAQREEEDRKAQAERDRMQAHRSTINDVWERARMAASQPLERIRAVIAEIEALPLDGLEELAEEGEAARADALHLMHDQADRLQARIAEEKIQAARRAELDRAEAEQRRQREEADRIARDVRAEQERALLRAQRAGPALLSAMQALLYAIDELGDDEWYPEEVQAARDAVALAI